MGASEIMPGRRNTWLNLRRQKDSKRSVSGIGNRKNGRLKRRGRPRSRRSVIAGKGNDKKEKDRPSLRSNENRSV